MMFWLRKMVFQLCKIMFWLRKITFWIRQMMVWLRKIMFWNRKNTFKIVLRTELEWVRRAGTSQNLPRRNASRRGGPEFPSGMFQMPRRGPAKIAPPMPRWYAPPESRSAG